MLKMRALPSILLLVALSLLLPEGLIAQPRPAKKIVEYEWDAPCPDFVRAMPRTRGRWTGSTTMVVSRQKKQEAEAAKPDKKS
ncbi:MAG TPA: hypothetical protein PKH24_18975 [Sedimentisphaerales bacterium]|jgi:hypothetical protein|nr:hypothetical protein [Sedimentisphaerales bacterium]HNU31162.1 hypothetical protein [Sedimentisphaerales bacterium]